MKTKRYIPSLAIFAVAVSCLLHPSPGRADTVTEAVTIRTSNGAVLNSQVVNFATNQLKLNGATLEATFPRLAGSYSDPTWITGLAWSKIASHPTTLSGYGITDAVANTITVNGHALSGNVTVAFSELGSKPTTLSGYGITDAVANTITVNGHALSGNVTVAFSELGSKPTTLSGYGITDAVPSSRTVNGHALSSNATVALSELGGVSISGFSLASGQQLTWNGSNWTNSFVVLPSIPAVLDDLDDVVISAPAEGDLLAFDSGMSIWTNVPPGGGASAWGGITGTLSAQADLQAALDTKPTATLDTDGTLAANSDTAVASQKAVRTYVDAAVPVIIGGFISIGADTVAANATSDLTFTVSGAVEGDVVAIGLDPAILAGSNCDKLTWLPFCSAPDTVVVRVHNTDQSSPASFGAGVIKAKVLK